MTRIEAIKRRASLLQEGTRAGDKARGEFARCAPQDLRDLLDLYDAVKKDREILGPLHSSIEAVLARLDQEVAE